MSYKLGIVGSRVWNPKITNPQQHAFTKLDKYVAKHGKPSLVISGGARGADTYGVLWAQARGIPIKEYKPDQRLIKMAGFRHAAMTRNTDIVNNSDRVVAFWDKKSKGTLDSLKKAKNLKKPTSYFNVGD